MPPDMDKSHEPPATSPGYETRDANTGGVLNFLVILGLVLVASALISWGMFRYFAALDQEARPDSPFAETRPLPLGPQLQVTPRADWLKYREEQERSLESYSWVNRDTGIVRVPIEQAMDILLKKGLPVQGEAPPAAPEKHAAPAAKGSKNP